MTMNTALASLFVFAGSGAVLVALRRPGPAPHCLGLRPRALLERFVPKTEKEKKK